MVEVLADPALYVVTGGGPPTAAELREKYGRQSLGRSADGAEVWHNWILRLRATGSAAGFVQATVVRPVVELAWVVGTAYQRRGLAAEAALAVRDALAPVGSGAVVQARIAPGHLASESVARRIGLEPGDDIDDDGERLWTSALR